MKPFKKITMTYPAKLTETYYQGKYHVAQIYLDRKFFTLTFKVNLFINLQIVSGLN